MSKKLLIVGLIVLGGVSSAFAAQCVHNGKKYPDNSRLCFDGTIHQCEVGQWNDLQIKCPESKVAKESTASADEWRLNKEGSSNICHVQISTMIPQLGIKVGEYPDRKAACEAGLTIYDADASDQTKCWGFGPGTIDGCAKDGVKLPKK